MSNNTTSLLERRKNLKWFQSRIENFNSVVPYHINALETIKNNIRKHHRLGNSAAKSQDRTVEKNIRQADRSIRQLEQLLLTIDNLREQVETSDHLKFDQLVSSSRENIKIALNDFNKFRDSIRLTERKRRQPDYFDQDNYDDEKENDNVNRQSQIVVQMSADRWELENELEIANSMQKIEQDSNDINKIFSNLHQIVQSQQEKVDSIEESIEETHSQVVAAERELVQVAAKAKGAMYPLVGAIIGSCVGGPIGLIGGLKIGAVVAFSGSILGFSSGKILKSKEQAMQKRIINDLDTAKAT